jgi:hypothetical protein
MAVSFSLRQITSVVTGPLYRVNNTVDAATDAPIQIFVFKTLTQVFSHYATVADLETYPDTYAEAVADDLAFYRLAEVERDWETIEEMESDVAMTQSRVQFLANELNAVQVGVPSDTTTLIVPE